MTVPFFATNDFHQGPLTGRRGVGQHLPRIGLRCRAKQGGLSWTAGNPLSIHGRRNRTALLARGGCSKKPKLDDGIAGEPDPPVAARTSKIVCPTCPRRATRAGEGP